MYSSPKSNAISGSGNQHEVIDLKLIIAKLFQYWWLFGISAIFCLIIAFFYAGYVSPQWHVSSKILVKDQKNSPQVGAGAGIGSDLGSLFSVKSSADNEIQILKSRTLMQNTVVSMQLNVRIYQKDGFKKREIYQECPFNAKIIYKADTLKAITYTLEILNEQEYNIKNTSDDVDIRGRFGKTLSLKQYDILLNYIPGAKHSKDYLISIESIDAAIDAFSSQFSAVLSDKQASTIDLGMTYSNPAKGEAILGKLMHLYLLNNIQYEKQIADSTMQFIDSRIALVSRELNNIEKQFEQYKTQNSIANINEQSKVLINSAGEYYNKLAEQETQLNVIKDLQRYLNNPLNKKVIPSSLLNPVDQSFGQAINAYNELLLSRDRALLSYTEDNPVVNNIDQQLNNSRINLLRNIEIYKNSLTAGKKQIEKQNQGFTGQLKQLPSKERNYLDFARQQNLKQELYLFLLQKREETAITKNSTMSSSRVIDVAKSEFLPYKPKKIIIYIIGLVIGIVIPSFYLFVKELLNVRINGKNDITNITAINILGEIGHNSDKQSLVTGLNSRSIISEQFRSLRTNLQFVLDNSKSNVILFTSSMSGEGKSFLSLNLGSALALTDKKVVFLEMDLRKPKLSESVGLGIENGFTNYAISGNNDYKKMLKQLSFNKNCYLISSGPIPPNPAELLMGGKLELLINQLKQEFDYIMIDCAPVGLVTDALIFEKYTDLTFYVIRQGFTYKSQLAIPDELSKENRMKNIYFIVNDVQNEKAGYSSFKQAYGYGIEEEESLLKRLFKRK
ncbi:GumC family protein [Mucilaginibacter terrae]|uniref:Tyrosine-protein kinase Etk/Wzc n=1 Tax=Mucilaginibacter terrae TaxID=1955052 RepID=A0ABU3GPR0_9SPHI|nr:polysaccharide biosynthesis tyrosine autokinase [Mucilaginibacter terrae]MDT3401768.1 tyrosine-protein kinase Etk/Wzc [Mucilaginibacter terrae]